MAGANHPHNTLTKKKLWTQPAERTGESTAFYRS
jgi:hypothetical protein